METDERFRAVFENAFDAMVVANDDGEYVQVNAAACELFGLPEEELLGRSIASFAPEGFEFETAWEQFRSSDRERGTFPLVRADGSERVVEYAATRDVVPGEHLSILRDVTSRRRYERTVTALHDVADDLAASDTAEAVCRRTIDAAEELLAFDQSVIALESDGALHVQAVSEDLPADTPTTMSVEEGLAGKTYRTGKSLLVDDVRTHEAANPQGPYRSAISLPVGTHGNFQAVSTDEGAFDETDRLLAELLVSHTANALDRLDRERALARQNDRLDAFARIVSHDLRNPLNVLAGSLEMAEETGDPERFAECHRELDRMNALIDDLLALSREGDRVGETEAVDLAALAENCWQHVDTEGATLVTETERTVRGDRSRLKQLFENLMHNAVEHGGDGVTVTVGDLADGFYVEDDGPGIPEAERDAVFDPGYSTAEDGTGFGLSIVEQVVEGHGWRIRVAESASGGARFEIRGVESVDG